MTVTCAFVITLDMFGPYCLLLEAWLRGVAQARNQFNWVKESFFLKLKLNKIKRDKSLTQRAESLANLKSAQSHNNLWNSHEKHLFLCVFFFTCLRTQQNYFVSLGSNLQVMYLIYCGKLKNLNNKEPTQRLSLLFHPKQKGGTLHWTLQLYYTVLQSVNNLTPELFPSNSNCWWIYTAASTRTVKK